MSTANPNTFSYLSSVIAPQALLINNAVRGQIDLRGKIRAELNVGVGRLSLTAYTNGVDIVVRRLHNPLGSAVPNLYGQRSVSSPFSRLSGLTASGTVTARVNTANALGDGSISIKTSNAGLTAYGSVLCFLGATAPGSLANADPIATLEFATMNKSAGSGPWTLTLRELLAQVHAVDDYVTTAAETFEISLPGGYVYDVIIDANNIVAGAGAAVRAIASVYSSDNLA